MSDKNLADSFNPLTPEEVQTYEVGNDVDAKQDQADSKISDRRRLAQYWPPPSQYRRSPVR